MRTLETGQADYFPSNGLTRAMGYGVLVRLVEFMLRKEDSHKSTALGITGDRQ